MTSTMVDDKPAVQLEGVSKRYKGRAVIPGLDLEVRRGEVFGLLGPNGAGKTTLIHLVLGLLRRDGGTVGVFGLDPTKDARVVRRRVGFVPQDTNLYDDLSALDNLWHHAALYCADLNAAPARIEALLKMMSLWDRRRDPPRAFSGGMKRRLALARALLHEPDLVVFDEPTLGVDVQGRHVLWTHLRALRDQGKTVVISTNDMSEADALCDRLMVFDRGRKVAVDSPEALKAALGRDVVHVRTDPDIEEPRELLAGFDVSEVSWPEPGLLRFEMPAAEARAGELIEYIARSHRLRWIRVARPSLDDVFLSLTGRGLREGEAA